MNAFYESVARVLEVESVDSTTPFRSVPGWCSLHAFGLLVLMENDWNTPLNITDLQKLQTVGELYAEAFVSFAAFVLKVPRAVLNAQSACGSIPEWDSVNHLRLVMEAEQRFGTSYPLETIPALKTLSDFIVRG